ncbi:MAG: glycosyltransferase family 4 protein, partial [Acidobacteriaceae bacterium]|nr:glycosyltransferase family 4 protein [Acidobacteriaceae bacterium]
LALSLGVPVIASRIGGLPEIIEDGVSGILVDNEPKAIAAAMDRLFLDTRFSKQLIEQGRLRIQSQFTLERLCKETIECYRRALGR